jgi:NADH dehydrogenase
VWFNHKGFTHEQAVRNTLALFDAARRAGVQRVVHVSITNPSKDSPLEYFRGKARLERGLIESGLSYAILRPAVLFGEEDILVNNIAWALRRLPVFGIFGMGRYRLQPIHVRDLAELAVALGRSRENVVIDAIGPETFTYRELVKEIARIIGKRRLVLPLPRVIAYLGAWATGKIMHDVMITWDEVKGLMAGLLCTNSPPAGTTRLTDWAREHADRLGKHYASELARRKNRDKAYGSL